MKLFTLVIGMFIVCELHAQRSAENFSMVQNQSFSYSGLRNVVDTIIPISFIPSNQGGLGCFTGVYSSDSGYVTGNNAYGDLEKAQFFDLAKMGYADTGAVQSVLVRFAYRAQGAQSEDVIAKIYSADSTGLPFNLLGTSQPVDLSSIPDNGDYTVFTFNTPVQVGDRFFASVQLPSDTDNVVAILSTQDNCTANSGWAWEQWSNGTWHSILDSWIRDVDLAIFPVAELPFGNGIALLKNDFQITIYPNPASDHVAIHFTENIIGPVYVSIFSPQGKMIKRFQTVVNPASGVAVLPIDEVTPSLYFMEVDHNGTKSRTPLIIVK